MKKIIALTGALAFAGMGCAGSSSDSTSAASASSSTGGSSGGSSAAGSSSHAASSAVASAASSHAASSSVAASSNAASSNAASSSAAAGSSSNGGQSSSEIPLPTDVPAAIQIPDGGVRVLLKTPAQGVQIYNCIDNFPDGGTLPDGSVQFGWKFVAPDAVLYDDANNEIGHHYAGPTWELGTDGGSKVTGVKLSGTAPDATAVPWLLLSVATNNNVGILSTARFIHRLHTVGGIAPAAAGCNQAALGTMQSINYTADYYFYGYPIP